MRESNKMATATVKGVGARSPLLRATPSSRGRWMGRWGSAVTQPLRLKTMRTFETLHQIIQYNIQKKGSSPPVKPKLLCSGEIPAVTKETGDCRSDLQPRLPALPSRDGCFSSRVALHRLRCLLLETGTPLHPQHAR